MERPTRTDKRVRVADYEYNDDVAERAAKRFKQEKEVKQEVEIKVESNDSENGANTEINPELQKEEEETLEVQEKPPLIAKRRRKEFYRASKRPWHVPGTYYSQEVSDSEEEEARRKYEQTTIPKAFHTKMIDFVVNQFNLDLNKKTQEGTTFLNYMIDSMEGISNVTLLSSLCYEYNLDLELVDANDNTPLLTAIEGAMPDVAVWLLKKGVSPNSPKSNLPLCRLMEAKMDSYSTFKVIDMLLTNGADIDEFNLDKNEKQVENPMMKAARYHLVDIMKYLMMRGAKADLEDSNGCTAMHHALYLTDDSIKQSKAIEFLAKHVDINKPNKAGLSPLLWAIEYGSSFDTVKALLDNGANVNQVEPQMLKTPAMMACMQTDEVGRPAGVETLGELMKYKIDVKAYDAKGHSLLYYFVKHYKPYCCDFFLPRGSQGTPFLARISHLMTDENIAFVINEAKKVLDQAKRDSSLLNNIFLLCAREAQYLAEFLIDHVGFDINTQDAQGNVLLSYPMNQAKFMYLMTKNPNVNIKNNEGKTPLKVLQEHYKEPYPSHAIPMINALIERGKVHQW